MLLGEDSGPVLLSAVHSPFWRSSVELAELALTHAVHKNNSLVYGGHKTDFQLQSHDFPTPGTEDLPVCTLSAAAPAHF